MLKNVLLFANYVSRISANINVMLIFSGLWNFVLKLFTCKDIFLETFTNTNVQFVSISNYNANVILTWMLILLKLVILSNFSNTLDYILGQLRKVSKCKYFHQEI